MGEFRRSTTIQKVYPQHAYDKNGNIKATFNIGIFCYLWHEINKYTLDLMVSYAVDITTYFVLL